MMCLGAMRNKVYGTTHAVRGSVHSSQGSPVGTQLARGTEREEVPRPVVISYVAKDASIKGRATPNQVRERGGGTVLAQ